MNDSQSSSWLPHSMAVTFWLIILDLICSRKILVLLNDVEPVFHTTHFIFP